MVLAGGRPFVHESYVPRGCFAKPIRASRSGTPRICPAITYRPLLTEIFASGRSIRRGDGAGTSWPQSAQDVVGDSKRRRKGISDGSLFRCGWAISNHQQVAFLVRPEVTRNH